MMQCFQSKKLRKMDKNRFGISKTQVHYKLRVEKHFQLYLMKTNQTCGINKLQNLNKKVVLTLRVVVKNNKVLFESGRFRSCILKYQ